MQRGVAQFGDVVRRDRGGHADRDAGRAVRQQVRKRRRQHHRLFGLPVVVRTEIDRVLVDPFEEQARDFGHARLGVAIGGRVIAVDVAEIALPVDQRITRVEILREAHQRIVDRLVAVRMEVAHHVADDLRRLLERGAGIEPQQLHPVQDAPVHRLETVARIRERTVHDGRERVREIALLQRLAERDFLHLAPFGGNHLFAHDASLMRARAMNNR
jgi:hypothetical protein